MSPVNGFILVSLIITLGFFGALISFLTDYELGKCEMTYMFEYPQFVRINNKIDETYKKYGLYAYSEGQLTKKARDMYFDGIPVLFIPGSGGSHKQVRSLASIALRKALNSRPGFHFNYFTIDLNEELTGLNGQLLEDQLYYANQSIYRVLELYEKRKDKPTSIVLVGHSMGGIIAKAIIASLPEYSDLIPLVINLASPTSRPPIMIDYHLKKMYDKIGKNATIPTQTTLISISGGYNDYLIPTYLTKGGHLNLVSTCVPRSWLTVDHLSILWCKQLVLAINRALFDSVDMKTHFITTDVEKRMQIFNHHLIHHSGTNVRLRERYQSAVAINNQGDWIESMYRQYTIRLPEGTRVAKWYMLPLNTAYDFEFLTVIGLNMQAIDWVFACAATNMRGSIRVCNDGTHLTHLSEITPSISYKRRILKINMHELKLNQTKATHVVVKVIPSDKPVVIHVDLHAPRERTISAHKLPKWFTYSKEVIVERTSEKAISYKIRLPHLTQVIQSYQLYLEPSDCSGNAHHASASLITPWDHASVHGYVTENERKPINIRLHTSRPINNTNSIAYIDLTLDPTCRYKISIQNIYHFGNMARFYSPLLIANLVAVILMTLRSQMMAMSNTERCPIFFTALKEGAKPYYAVTAVKILTTFLSNKMLLKLIPAPDGQILINENLDFLLLPLLLYMVSVGIVWLLSVVLTFFMVFFETTFHKFLLKLIQKTVSGSATLSDYFINSFKNVPEFVAVLLILLCFSTCGGLALILAVIFYYIKLIQMSQDYIEDIVWKFVKTFAKKLKDKVVKRVFNKKTDDNVTKNKDETIDSTNKAIKDKAIDSKNKSNEIKAEVIDSKNKSNEIKAEAVDSKNKSNEIKAEAIDSKNKSNEVEEEAIDSKNKAIEDNKSDDSPKHKNKKLKSTKSSDEIKTDIKEKINEIESDFIENENEIENNKEANVIDTEKDGEEIKTESSIDYVGLFKNILENNEIFFHFTIFLIYGIVACLNIPYVLTWAHNFKYTYYLENDPSFIPGLILCICALPLWHFDFPRVNIQFYKELSIVVYGAALLCLIYGSVSIYRLNYILITLIIIIVLHQLGAIKKPLVQTIDENETKNDDKNMYNDKVKAKIE